MARLRPGHYGDAKPVGDGVDELRIFEGKGYRVDFKRQDDWKRIMELKTTPYEASDYLDSPEAVEAYLEAAFETNDVALISVAIARHGKRRFVVLSTEDFEVLRHGTDSRTVHHVNDLDDAEALQLMTALQARIDHD